MRETDIVDCPLALPRGVLLCYGIVRWDVADVGDWGRSVSMLKCYHNNAMASN